MNLLVSACLMGLSCRYDGRSNLTPRLEEIMARYTCIPVCAEVFGGLPTPRVPSERSGDKVLSKEGQDVTAEFVRGAQEVVRLAELYHCSAALLKEKSPSCGSGKIYDGTLSKTLIPGDGVLTQMLREKGLTIYGESQVDALLQTCP